METNGNIRLNTSHLLSNEEPEIDQQIINKQEEINQFQKNAPVKEVQYAKTFIPIPSSLKEKLEN